jgi:glycosyltransferase involved in cell wall biosynthesis
MKLLFITQKIHENDDDLAFVTLWIRQFIKQGFDVKVICLQKGDFKGDFPIYSLRKERGYGKIRRTLRFLKFIFSLDYDRVFVHMNPEYFSLGGWYWFLRRIPTYLWYTHYTMHIHLRLAGFFTKRMFAATPQSLPQYNNSSKKVVTGHGIDVDFWLNTYDPQKYEHKKETELLTVHRICRSKRLEITIKALKRLPSEYTLTVYGRDVEKDYYQEMQDLVKTEGLSERVQFMGPVPMHQLRDVYGRYRLMVNMAYETIDKTMLEAMLFGAYPITTKANSIAIGLPIYPEHDEPQALADSIKGKEWQKYSRDDLVAIVKKDHSLEALIRKMGAYIKEGK